MNPHEKLLQLIAQKLKGQQEEGHSKLAGFSDMITDDAMMALFGDDEPVED